MLINWFKRQFSKLSEMNKHNIMYVNYDISTNKIECFDWVSQKIGIFTGDFTGKLLEEIKPWCDIESNPGTKIYIWSGNEEYKHLSYNEPIEDYLYDIKLWTTGQGFDYESNVRYGESTPVRCPLCKR